MSEKSIKTSDYVKVSLQEAMGLLKTNADGLSAEEVKKRLKEFGYNEITETKKNPLLQFLRRYRVLPVQGFSEGGRIT